MIDVLFSLLGDLNPNAAMTAAEMGENTYTPYEEVEEKTEITMFENTQRQIKDGQQQ